MLDDPALIESYDSLRSWGRIIPLIAERGFRPTESHFPGKDMRLFFCLVVLLAGGSPRIDLIRPHIIPSQNDLCRSLFKKH
jgi:hypothetical protein